MEGGDDDEGRDGGRSSSSLCMHARTSHEQIASGPVMDTDTDGDDDDDDDAGSPSTAAAPSAHSEAEESEEAEAVQPPLTAVVASCLGPTV